MDTDLHQIIRSSQPLTDDHYQYFIYQEQPCLDVVALLSLHAAAHFAGGFRQPGLEQHLPEGDMLWQAQNTCLQQVAKRVCAYAHTWRLLCRSCAG